MDERASVCRCRNPVLTRSGERFACRFCDYCQWRDAREINARSDREFLSLQPGTWAVMGTLTFRPEALPEALPDWGRSAWRAFAKALSAAGVAGVKYFAVPEFGELRGRLHVHFVAFGVPDELCQRWEVLENGHAQPMFGFRELVRKAWAHGFERCDVCRDRGGGRYVMKYVAKGRAGALRERAEWRERKRAAEARGLRFDEVLSSRWWIAWPRGRVGGLARQFAERLAEVSKVHPLVRAGVDLPAHLLSGGRRVGITRYERRVARRALGLDSEAAAARRAALNPEPLEMAARIEAAGSVQWLRVFRGHVDEDVASVFRARARVAKSLGRW